MIVRHRGGYYAGSRACYGMPRCSPSSVIINITSVFVYSQRKEESVIDFTEKPICTVIRVMLEFSPYPPSFSLNSSVKMPQPAIPSTMILG